MFLSWWLACTPADTDPAVERPDPPAPAPSLPDPTDGPTPTVDTADTGTTSTPATDSADTGTAPTTCPQLSESVVCFTWASDNYAGPMDSWPIAPSRLLAIGLDTLTTCEVARSPLTVIAPRDLAFVDGQIAQCTGPGGVLALYDPATGPTAVGSVACDNGLASDGATGLLLNLGYYADDFYQFPTAADALAGTNGTPWPGPEGRGTGCSLAEDGAGGFWVIEDCRDQHATRWDPATATEGERVDLPVGGAWVEGFDVLDGIVYAIDFAPPEVKLVRSDLATGAPLAEVPIGPSVNTVARGLTCVHP